MKFLTKKKSTLALIALICFAFNLIYNLIGSIGDIFEAMDNMFDSFGLFLLSANSILSILISLLIPLFYLGCALFVWKKNSHMKLLCFSGLCIIVNIFLTFIGQIISFITFQYFDFNPLVNIFVSNLLPFLFAAYLVIFSLLKVKGPAVPIAGAAFIGLMLVAGVLGGSISFIEDVFNLFDYFSWDLVRGIITNLFDSTINLISQVGLLLLVPAALYIPKENPEEVFIEEN